MSLATAETPRHPDGLGGLDMPGGMGLIEGIPTGHVVLEGGLFKPVDQHPKVPLTGSVEVNFPLTRSARRKIARAAGTANIVKVDYSSIPEVDFSLD